jgi:putative nitroreductase
MTTQTVTPVKKPNEAWFEDTWWWKIKLRLQWTGWMQYLPNLTAALMLALMAGIGALIGVASWLLVGLPLILATILAANLVFDVATVRFGLHPAEPLPEPRHDPDDFALIRARVSCRSFQNRNLTDAHRQQVLQLADLYSRAENRLGNRPVRFEYLNAPLTVWPVVGATEFLVAITEKEYHEQAVIDVGRSLQNVVIEATRLGLATCWIGPGADPSSIASHLGARFDASKDHVICVCAIGYASRYKPATLRMMQRSQRQRKDLPELFFQDVAFSEPIDATASAIAPFRRCMEICQWSPSSYNGQTTRAVMVVENDRLVRVDFCAANKSRYYAMVALGIWIANWEKGCRALGVTGHMSIVPAEDEGRATLPRYLTSWVREGD